MFRQARVDLSAGTASTIYRQQFCAVMPVISIPVVFVSIYTPHSYHSKTFFLLDPDILMSITIYEAEKSVYLT